MIDPRVKPRHLRTFVEVARRGSVGQIAEALAVTQPLVSKTVDSSFFIFFRMVQAERKNAGET